MKGTEPSPVQLDHCYAKPWNWRQEMAHCKPIRVLFAENSSPVWYVLYTLWDYCNCIYYFRNFSDDVIDVEVPSPVKHHSILDTELTDKNYVESVQKLSLLSTDENNSDWEETVKRDGWTPLQNRIFNKVLAFKNLLVFSQTNPFSNRL